MSFAPPKYYHIVDQEVAHETMDGEVIIIHFQTGNYYSLNGMAARIWSWLDAGASHADILGAFQDLTPEGTASTDAFLQALAEDGILHPSELPPSSPGNQGARPAPQSCLFQIAKFEKFNDMQQLLLSDPIHEVNEKGWPNVKTETGA